MKRQLKELLFLFFKKVLKIKIKLVSMVTIFLLKKNNNKNSNLLFNSIQIGINNRNVK
jgi:hypothetical protein